MKLIKFFIVFLISFSLINLCNLKSMANEYENGILERLTEQRDANITKQNAVKSNSYGSLLYEGKGFNLYYSLNSYGTISISIYENENSYLYFDSIYKWNFHFHK